jgi:type II secretory pathway pseudopilin PulG
MIGRIPRARAGITLTEILISIMILGIGMISLATLFPIGLLKLRESTRASRSAILAESATQELESRNLLAKPSFQSPITAPWFVSSNANGFANLDTSLFSYDPFTQDTPSPYAMTTAGNGGAMASMVGLPIAYDPLWRLQASYSGGVGVPLVSPYPEARFGSGIGWVRNDPIDGGVPSAHGLQRISNFYSDPTTFANNLGNGYSPANYLLSIVAPIFVSPEDYVFQSLSDGQVGDLNGNGSRMTTSPVVPEIPLDTDGTTPLPPVNEWRFSWMFTGRQVDTNGTTFEGDIVVFENRPFSLDSVGGDAPFPAQYTAMGETAVRPGGEIVVEAVFGLNNTGNALSYLHIPDRSVLLRWPASMPDPEVKVGSWIADVTYERDQGTANSRFGLNGGRTWPAQRCFWYQIVKKSEPTTDATISGARSMTVYVNAPLRARTYDPVLGAAPVNAALICPSVVNVFPKTIHVR